MNSFALYTTPLHGTTGPIYLSTTARLTSHRRMDILNADLVLFRDMEKWGKAKKYRRKRVVKRQKDDENEPGFHFIAYVPIDGAVWKLDGLQRQPDNLGTAHTPKYTIKLFVLITQRIISTRLDGPGCSTYQ